MDKLKLTGLWQNKTKSGEVYYGGNLSPGVRILVFKNGFKQGEKDPDLVVYLAPSARPADAEGQAVDAEKPQESDGPFSM